MQKCLVGRVIDSTARRIQEEREGGMSYKTSETINELSASLASAQREIEGAPKDSANPYYKSKYADLASVWNAVREPLGKFGLAILQMPSADGAKVTITTMLAQSSGQWISSDLTMTAKDDTPQAVGSAITYARRYALQSFAGVAPEDDDGEGAQGRGSSQPNLPIAAEPDLRQTINDAAGRIQDKYQAAGVGPLFLQVLGREGYESISQIPTDYKVAARVIEVLKVELAGAKKAQAEKK
jgi:hypothetical protein